MTRLKTALFLLTTSEKAEKWLKISEIRASYKYVTI